MITQDQIKMLASKYQTTELNCRREYLQHLFLSYFYQQPQTDIVYFKGGTALKIIFHSPRFSEDLDFSTKLSGIKSLQQAILQTMEAIERENINIYLKETKKTSGGYLANITFQAFEQTTEFLLQFSLREGNKQGEVVTIANDFIPPYLVVSLHREQLVGEKIQALLDRKKPRDFYDLYFILRSSLLPVKGKNILPTVLKIIQQTNINFEKELKQFLPKSHWAVIKDFKQTLLREIERFT